MRNSKFKVISLLSGLAMAVSIGTCDYAAYGEENVIGENSAEVNAEADYLDPIAEMSLAAGDNARAIEPAYVFIEATGEMKPGNTICMEINFEKFSSYHRSVDACIFNLKYDTDLFEDVSVEAGDICTNVKKNFSKKVDESTGAITVMFVDITDNREECISNDGVFARIYLKVKDTYDGSESANQSINITKDIDYEVLNRDYDDINSILSFEDKTTKVETSSSASISVQESGESSSNMINPTFKITNTGDSFLPLKNLKFNYYYSKEGNIDQTFNCYYAGTTDGNYKALTSNVVGKICDFSGDRTAENTDSYMEISFNGGTLDAGQSMTIQTAVNKNDWSVYDRSNDWSYNNADNIAVFLKDKLVYGEKPVYVNRNLSVYTSAVYDVVNDGDTVSIPVRFSGASKKNSIKNFTMNASFDNELFECTGIVPSDVCPDSENSFTSDIVNKDGSISVKYNNESEDLDKNITTDYGILFTVNFKVINGKQDRKIFTNLENGSAEFIDQDNEIMDLKLNFEKPRKFVSLSDNYIIYNLDDGTEQIPVKIYLDDDDNNLVGIYYMQTYGDITGTALRAGRDYTVDETGTLVTLTHSYLASLNEDDARKLEFRFSNGEKCTLRLVNNGELCY